MPKVLAFGFLTSIYYLPRKKLTIFYEFIHEDNKEKQHQILMGLYDSQIFTWTYFLLSTRPMNSSLMRSVTSLSFETMRSTSSLLHWRIGGDQTIAKAFKVYHMTPHSQTISAGLNYSKTMTCLTSVDNREWCKLSRSVIWSICWSTRVLTSFPIRLSIILLGYWIALHPITWWDD